MTVQMSWPIPAMDVVRGTPDLLRNQSSLVSPDLDGTRRTRRGEHLPLMKGERAFRRICQIGGVLVVLAFVFHTHLFGRLLANAQAQQDTKRPKKITFIRHGESLGNLIGRNPVKYALEARGSPIAWKDGRLSEGGKQATIDRVMGFDESLLDRILDADVVLVSPLIRAMETCMIVLSTAITRKVNASVGAEGFVFMEWFRKLQSMKFVVMSDLREKLSSESDKPGASGVDVSQYLIEVVNHLNEQGSPQQVITNVGIAHQLIKSYQAEKSRTNSWEEDPDNADKFLAAIMRFRTDLDRLPEKNILIIGHNSWSRWTFAAGLNGACEDAPFNNNLSHIAFGGRQVQELANVGAITAKFAENKFQDPKVYNADGTTCKKTKFGLFSSIAEAKAEGLVPRDTSVHRVLTKKKMDFAYRYKVRWVTFSATGGHSMLAWGNEMGEPGKVIDLVFAKLTSTLQYACDFEYSTLHLSNPEKSLPTYGLELHHIKNVKPFHLQIASANDQSSVEFKRMCLLMHIHTKFGGNAQFIADIFEEIGWDRGIADADLDVHLSQSLLAWKARWDQTDYGIKFMTNYSVQEVTGGVALEALRSDTKYAIARGAAARQEEELRFFHT